jgi:hypothetical protein
MEMVKEVRKEMDMPFINDRKTMDFIHPIILNDSLKFQIDTKEIKLHSEIFNQIWQYRMNLLPLVVVFSNVSQAQQFLLIPIIDRGEKLLTSLEAYQADPLE